MTHRKMIEANRISLLIYYGIMLLMLVIAIVRAEGAYLLSMLGAGLLIPLVPKILYRFCGVRPVYLAEIVFDGFVFCAVVLGSALNLYEVVPFFDKILHGIAGILMTAAGAALYYGLKPGHEIRRDDAAQAAVFMWMSSAAGAVIWETYEFVLSHFTTSDPQRVAETGVGDTMGDMIVCMVGGLAATFLLYRCIRRDGRIRGPLSALFRNLYDTLVRPGQSPNDKPS